MTDATGFESYRLWNALKLHFTSNSYNFFQYNGKTNVSQQTFMKNKFRWHFTKLSRKYSLEELKDFYVANFIVDKGDWVMDLLQEGDDNYQKWQKRIQSLTYNFQNDMTYLLDQYGIKGEEIFRVDRGNYPKLLEEVMRGKVSIETLIILNNETNFVSGHWTPRINDDIIWPSWQRKIERYAPFIQYDKAKFKQILKEKIKEYA
jgi:hypothetical protein